MRFVIFKTPKPKRFHIVARYHNPELERMRKRRAEMGYEEAVSHDEELRMKMRRRWKGEKEEAQFQSFGISKRISFLVYATLIMGGVYLLFFTDFIDKLLLVFGVGKVK